MFERFADAARAVIVAAHEESGQLGHRHIGTEHLLLGLLRDGSSDASVVLAGFGVDYPRCRAAVDEVLAPGESRPLDAEALRSVGIDLDAVRRRAEEAFGPGALDAPATRRGASQPLTPRSKKVLQLALREAVHQGSRTIGTDHLLLGILREGNGLAARVLRDSGVDLTALRTALLTHPHPA